LGKSSQGLGDLIFTWFLAKLVKVPKGLGKSAPGLGKKFPRAGDKKVPQGLGKNKSRSPPF
jgi:hypothetical protein